MQYNILIFNTQHCFVYRAFIISRHYSNCCVRRAEFNQQTTQVIKHDDDVFLSVDDNSAIQSDQLCHREGYIWLG